jgi:hypothetical protein
MNFFAALHAVDPCGCDARCQCISGWEARDLSPGDFPGVDQAGDDICSDIAPGAYSRPMAGKVRVLQEIFGWRCAAPLRSRPNRRRWSQHESEVKGCLMACDVCCALPAWQYDWPRRI